MNYKIIIIAFFFFACKYPEAEQEELEPKKEADKQTEIPIVYANEKGIVTREALYKQLNIKGLYYAFSIVEGYFKKTKETAPGEEPIGVRISPFEHSFSLKIPGSYKLKQKGSRGYVSIYLAKKDVRKFPEQELIRIDFWAVWE